MSLHRIGLPDKIVSLDKITKELKKVGITLSRFQVENNIEYYSIFFNKKILNNLILVVKDSDIKIKCFEFFYKEVKSEACIFRVVAELMCLSKETPNLDWYGKDVV